MPANTATQLDVAGDVSTRDRDHANRAVKPLDLVLFALCCAGLLLYLIESESIRYLLSHLGLRL
jgi:hypothetical protein